MGGFFASPGFSTEYLHAYVASGLVPTQQSLDETEKIEVHPTPWPRVLELIRGNEIRDAKSISLLLKATMMASAGA